MEIGLVSCVKGKRNEPAPPGDLYTSQYFTKMQTYAEQEHDEWYILSAKHGLLDPDGEPIEPYEESLTNASVSERRKWAADVATQLEAAGLLEEDVTLVIHAGKAYYEELLPHLEETSVEVRLPTEGLGIGEKLGWYSARI